MKMKMSNDWWNMQRVGHPTTSNCHHIEEYAIISVEAVAKKKKTQEFFVFRRIFMKVKFLVSRFLAPAIAI